MKEVMVFTEYKIKDEQRTSYLNVVSKLKRELEHLGAKDVFIFEGVDQEGLFVEEFKVEHIKMYEKIKHARNSSSNVFWRDFHSFITKKQVSMWAFEKVK